MLDDDVVVVDDDRNDHAIDEYHKMNSNVVQVRQVNYLAM